MKPLADFADQHPLATGAVGALSGITAKLLAGLHVVAGIAADVGAIATAACALLSVAILTRRFRRDRWHRAAERDLVERREREFGPDFPNHGDE